MQFSHFLAIQKTVRLTTKANIFTSSLFSQLYSLSNLSLISSDREPPFAWNSVVLGSLIKIILSGGLLLCFITRGVHRIFLRHAVLHVCKMLKDYLACLQHAPTSTLQTIPRQDSKVRMTKERFLLFIMYCDHLQIEAENLLARKRQLNAPGHLID